MILLIINDFLHLLATATWIGGMLYLNVVLIPSLKSIEPLQSGKLQGTVAKRFAFIAWGSVIILLVTGLIKTPSGMLFDITTTYGIALTVKIILFLIMIIIGVIISFILVPKMEKMAPTPGEKPSLEFGQLQKQISSLAFTNMILGVITLICVAVP